MYQVFAFTYCGGIENTECSFGEAMIEMRGNESDREIAMILNQIVNFDLNDREKMTYGYIIDEFRPIEDFSRYMRSDYYYRVEMGRVVRLPRERSIIDTLAEEIENLSLFRYRN